MMKCAHKTISQAGDLKLCSVLQNTKHGVVDSLFLYPRRAVFVQVQCLKDKIAVTEKTSFILETPLLWLFSNGQFVFAITETHRLLVARVSDKRDRFELVSDTEILETDQEFRFFSASLSNNFFCIAGRDCYCLVFDVTCPSAPKCEPIWLGERMVIDLKAGKEECFNILTENQDGQRELVVVDANTACVAGVVPAEIDVESLLCAGEAQSPETMEVRRNRIAGVETPGRVLCFSEIGNDRVSCFCEGGAFVTVYDKANVVIVDGAPALTSIFTLPNGLVVCFADDGPVYVVKPPDPGSAVKQWKDLLIFEMERVTHLDSIVFDSGQLLMLSGMDVIQLTNQGDWGSDDAICDIGADMHLVCCHHDHMVATSRDESCSRLLKSASGQICEDQRTLHILFKNKKLYQVTPMGVYTNKKPEVSFACSAKLASSCDNGKSLCVVFENNSVTCYRGNQTSTLDILKGSVTACDVSSDFVVVAVFYEEEMMSHLILYSKNLEEFGKRIPVPSFVNSVKFGEHGKCLYVGSANGTVFKCLIEKAKGFSGHMHYLFIGAGPIELASVQSSSVAFLSQGMLYLYHANRLVSTGIAQVTSISSLGANISYAKDGKVYVLDPESFDDKHEPIILENEKVARQTFTCGMYSVCWKENTILVAGTDSERKASLEFDDVTSIACRKEMNGNTEVVIVLAKKEIVVARYVADNDTFEHGTRHSFKELTLEKVCAYEDMYVLLTNGRLCFCTTSHDDVRILRMQITMDQPIRLCEVYKQSIWACCGDHTVTAYRFDRGSSKMCMTCQRIYSSRISLLKPFDDLTAVVCFEGGMFQIIQIPAGAFHGFVKSLFGKAPEFEICLSCCLPHTVIGVSVLDDAIIYATEQGAVGSFIPMTSLQVFNEMAAFQRKVRGLYETKIGICRRSRSSIANLTDIVDLDLIYAYLELDDAEQPPFCPASTMTSVWQALNF